MVFRRQLIDAPPIFIFFLLSCFAFHAGMVIQGRNIDIQTFNDNLMEQEQHNIKFPDVLKGSLGFQRCSCIIKRSRPVNWRVNGVTFISARELTMCKTKHF